MFCPKCGKQLPDGAKFCSGCGSVLDAPRTGPQKPAGQKPAWQDIAKRSSEKLRKPAKPKPASGGSAPQGSKGLLGMEDGVCPDCGSHDCEVQLQQNTTTSGSSYNCLGGACGAILAGPFGLLCGLCGAGKKTTTTNQSVWLCKKCGNQFPTRKDKANRFIIVFAAPLMAVPLCIVFAILFFMLVPPVGLVFAALEAVTIYATWKTKKRYLGDCPLKDAVANGLLTQEESRLMVIACLSYIALGAVMSVIFFLLL